MTALGLHVKLTEKSEGFHWAPKRQMHPVLVQWNLLLKAHDKENFSWSEQILSEHKLQIWKTTQIRWNMKWPVYLLNFMPCQSSVLEYSVLPPHHSTIVYCKVLYCFICSCCLFSPPCTPSPHHYQKIFLSISIGRSHGQFTIILFSTFVKSL